VICLGLTYIDSFCNVLNHANCGNDVIHSYRSYLTNIGLEYAQGKQVQQQQRGSRSSSSTKAFRKFFATLMGNLNRRVASTM
jgi:hypothetical protein